MPRKSAPSSGKQDPPVGLPHAPVSRRRLLQAGVAAGITGVTLASGAGEDIEAAAAQTPAGSGALQDIEHVVILMQENRSFDHYFGTLSHVRGFSDKKVIDPDRQRGLLPDLRPVRLPTGGRTRRRRLPAAVPPAQ